MKYDVIVVGMGPSSVFLAYELIKLKKAKNVLLIEEGRRVEKKDMSYYRMWKMHALQASLQYNKWIFWSRGFL